MKAPGVAPGPAAFFLVTLSAAVGFAMMLVEITATRLMAPFFGTSVYTWTNVIAAIMAALAGGYYLGGKLADRWPRVETALFVVLTSGLLTALVPLTAPGLSGALSPAETTLVSTTPLLVRTSLLVTLVVFAPPVFFMAALSPVVVRLLCLRRDVGWASGVNSAAATIGAILGTFAPTLWLVPALGSRKTVLLAAALQLLLALGGFIALRRWRPAAVAALGVGALAAVGLAASAPLRDAPGLVEEQETRYQYARVVHHDSQTELKLESEVGGCQSLLLEGSYLTGGAYYDHALLMPFFAGKPAGAPLKVLVIGLGAGTVARQYYHFWGPLQKLTVVGVEIDPALPDLGRRHFRLDESVAKGLRVVAADGRTFLAMSPERFDVILIDVFSHEVFIPFHLATREFFDLVRRHLTPGGVVGMNVVVERFPSRLLDALEGTVADVFGAVWHEKLPGAFNVQLLAAGDGRLDVLGARGRLAAYPPATTPIAEGAALRTLLEQGIDQVARYSPPPGGLVFTDDRAPVEKLTMRDLERFVEVQ